MGDPGVLVENHEEVKCTYIQRGWATRRLDDEDDEDDDVEVLPNRGLALITDTATTQNKMHRTPPQKGIPSQIHPPLVSSVHALDRSGPSDFDLHKNHSMGKFGARRGGCLLIGAIFLLLAPPISTAGEEPDGVEGTAPPFNSMETNHLQYVQEDINEWKWETTQSLQRHYLQKLFDLSKSLQDHPDRGKTYEDIRDHLDEHCERVYNGTCEWQFSPPFDSKSVAHLPPPSVAEKESAAIVYLCCADAKEFDDLLWSLKFLDLNFNNHFQYPVLIFHENFGDGQKNQIMAITRSPIEFHKVEFRVPTFLDPNYVPRWFQGYSLGFRHMIRFFTITLWDHPAMQQYKYYFRLDSDSFLISRLWTDPFKFFSANDFKFGFVATTTEDKRFLPDLWEITEAFRRGRGMESQWFSGKWNGFSFYSNLEIGRVDYWQQPAVQEYLRMLDGAGGIFKVRWPDSAIHFLCAMLFLHSQEMVQLVFIPYWHHNVVILPQPWIKSSHKNPDGTPKTASQRAQGKEL